MSELVRVGVATLVWENAYEVRLLLGLRKGGHGAGMWQLPGGRMEFGEDPAITACREVEEETGLFLEEVEVYKPHPFNSTVIDGQHWVTLFFQSNSPLGVPVLREPDKCEKWDWHHLLSSEVPSSLFPPLEKLLRSGALRNRGWELPRKSF